MKCKNTKGKELGKRCTGGRENTEPVTLHKGNETAADPQQTSAFGRSLRGVYVRSLSELLGPGARSRHIPTPERGNTWVQTSSRLLRQPQWHPSRAQCESPQPGTVTALQQAELSVEDQTPEPLPNARLMILRTLPLSYLLKAMTRCGQCLKNSFIYILEIWEAECFL